MENLKPKDIKELQDFLDDIEQPNTWYDVGNHIFHGDQQMLEKVDQLHNAYCGGGSPGSAFIDIFKILSDCTVGEFQTFPAKLHRNDIVKLIEENVTDNNEKFADLQHHITRRISALLDQKVAGIKNWRDFAYEYKYDEKLVKSFHCAVKEKQQHSPTEALLTLIKTNQPQYKLSDFSMVLFESGCNDVKIYINNLITSFS